MADPEPESDEPVVGMVGLHGRVPASLKEQVTHHALWMGQRDGKVRRESHAIRELLVLGLIEAEKLKPGHVDVKKLKKRGV